MKTKANNTTDYFPPNVSFFQLKIVWITIAIISFLAIAIAVTIFLNSKLESDFSFYGWNNFISYFKVPLATLALLIPIGAIYATNHRSRQTLEQMRLTTEQNNFANYYKHIEEFEKFCETHCESISKTARRHLHSFLFPNSKNGIYTVDNRIFDIAENHIDVMIDDIKNYDWDDNVLFGIVESHTLHIMDISKKCNLEKIMQDYQRNVDKLKVSRNDQIVEANVIAFQLSLCYLSFLFNSIASTANFDTAFEVPENINRLMSRAKRYYASIRKLGSENERNQLPYLKFKDEKIQFRDRNGIAIVGIGIELTCAEFLKLKEHDLEAILHEDEDYVHDPEVRVYV